MTSIDNTLIVPLEDDLYRDEFSQRRGLLPKDGKQPRSLRRKRFDLRLRRLMGSEKGGGEFWRPYILGLGLFLVLFSFWLMDSLKDPIFGALVNGELSVHQPKAKIFSVVCTIALVFFTEYVAQERKRKANSDRDILDGGGTWKRMGIVTSRDVEEVDATKGVSVSIFSSIGLPYFIFFGLMAYLLQFNPVTSLNHENAFQMGRTGFWRTIAYCFYAAIESFGSIAVATFWSYANSTLSLHQAESYYGTIIAMAQMGAIAGSTMVAVHVWNSITLFIVACLVILLHIVVMTLYDRNYPPTNDAEHEAREAATPPAKESEQSLLSGIHLILKHNYVLLILGVSCLYEVSMTCLNYQMTLLGWSKFEEAVSTWSFTQFMGRYGQLVNVSSFLLSSVVFPVLIRTIGLKFTLRLFPTLLIVANVAAFILFKGNLVVLVVCLSILKAMTYSIHDPAKEILYIPTSGDIKFKAKFWIDIVGARLAKAAGSSLNDMSGTVDASIRLGIVPSLLTAVALWYACYKVGIAFEELIDKDTIVGVDDVDPLRPIDDMSAEHDMDGDGRGPVNETNQAMELTVL